MAKKPIPSEESQDLLAALKIMQAGGLKKTQGRQLLLEFLVEEHGPFTVDEIFSGLKKHAIDRVTLYRCLTAFEEIGLVRRCEFGDGTSRYELQLDPEHHHHHIICKVCRKSESLEHCELPSFDKQARRLGFSQVTHSLELFGVCADCTVTAGV